MCFTLSLLNIVTIVVDAMKLACQTGMIELVEYLIEIKGSIHEVCLAPRVVVVMC